MRGVRYPADLRKFKREYLAVFDIKGMQRRWQDLWNANRFIKTNFPKRIHKILLADYHHLFEYYRIFTHRNPRSISAAEMGVLKSIFNYSDKYQSDIAGFFMNHSSDLDLSVCHYCETAYTNCYQVPDNDEEHLYYLNTASFDSLKKKFRLCDRTINAIIAMRQIRSLDDFERQGMARKFWNKPYKVRGLFPKTVLKNHFDIDHVLDKGSCPLVALSLMNFVPSCQICNQRLKRSYPLGDRRRNAPIEHLSPTSPSFDFDEKVEIRLIPKTRADGTLPDPAFAIYEKDYYELDFSVSDSDFNHFISLFHLKERYQFHKEEGLYWIQAKERYSDSAIFLMANGLGVPQLSKDRIKEDIFRHDYDMIRKPTFAKLKRDCLK